MEIKDLWKFERFVGMSPPNHKYPFILNIPTAEM
jgi:hypothetical protein